MQAALNQPQDTIKAIESMQTEVASLKKEIQGLAKLQLQAIKEQLAGELETLNGIQFLATEVDLDAGLMKDLAFDLGQNKDALFLVLASSKGGKPLLSCYISKELVAAKDLNAGTIVRELGKYIQGGGGGQAFFATAGGKNTDGIAAALKAAREMI